MADRNLIIILVDQEFFQARRAWQPYVNAMVKEAKVKGDLVIPISIHADAARISPNFADLNHIFVQDSIPLADDERIYQAIFTALLRLLPDNLPQVFLCHAKHKAESETLGDGERIARQVRQYLYEETQLSCFFDLHDIPHGEPVRKSIEGAIRQSVILVVWTDRLLDSPWCQFELIEARLQQRPIVVLDAAGWHGQWSRLLCATGVLASAHAWQGCVGIWVNFSSVGQGRRDERS